MIKRTIEISREKAHLSVKNRQLIVTRANGESASIPCEDIGLVLVDHPGDTYTHQALVALADNGALLIACGNDHLPLATMVPMPDHGEVVWRLRDQIAASRPLTKRLWQQLVIAKVKAQADNLSLACLEHKKLTNLAATVRSGDPENIEAQAARIYWRAWLDKDLIEQLGKKNFKRDPDGVGLNACLNYGYSVLRAAVARAIVAAGLNPSLGVFHRNRSNAFCLADDLMEPFRPIIDARVRNCAQRLGLNVVGELSQTVKAELLESLTECMSLNTESGRKTGPLMVMLHRLAASLSHCYGGERRDLLIAVRDSKNNQISGATWTSQGTE